MRPKIDLTTLERDLEREIALEEARFGDVAHSAEGWQAVLGEEFGEVAREVTALMPPRGRTPDPAKYRKELLQVAAVAMRTIAALDGGRMTDVAGDNRVLRYLLWLRHGHDGLYGDDGEMQCSRCALDFKRAPVAEIEASFTRQGREQFARLQGGGS